MEEYRKKKALEYKLYSKYSKLLELNPKKRSVYVIQNFIKKKILFDPINVTKEDISFIPALYRYRTFVGQYDQETLNIINLTYDQYEEEAKSEITELELLTIRLIELKDERKNMINNVKQTTIKLPILLDLRLYGQDVTQPIVIDDNVYYLDETQQKQILNTYKKISDETTDGKRFQQTLKWSKALSDLYANK